MSPDNFASRLANDYIHNHDRDINTSSSTDTTRYILTDSYSFILIFIINTIVLLFSMCSTDEFSTQNAAAFPFKPTPSGNLKVQSNQVIFHNFILKY